MRLLTTLYITEHRAKLTSSHRSLVVMQPEGKRLRVPLEALEAVVIVGHAQVSSEALAACVERRVRVTSLQGNGRVRFAVGAATTGNVYLRSAQHQAAGNPEHASDLARWIVAGKLENARRLLQRWVWDARASTKRVLRRLEAAVATRVDAVAGAIGGDRIRGFEGDGTRIYFEAMRVHLQATGCRFGFENRNRRPPRDPVNACLGFAYGLLLSETVGALEGLGLDPQVGFLHGVRAGRPALGLDLLEEFRPSIADRFVTGLFARQMLDEDDFTTSIGAACYLTDRGRRKFLEAYEEFKSAELVHPLLERPIPRGALPVVQATLLARHLRGDIPAYLPMSW